VRRPPDFERSLESEDSRVAEIRSEWGAYVYRPKPKKKKKKSGPPPPILNDLIPPEKLPMLTATWLSKFEGVPAREIYRDWTWIEVWEQVAVHLALHYSTDDT
jgi:hypothetical protein